MPVAKRMRAMPSRAAASVAARAAKTVPETATTTGAPSTCRSRTSPFPRRRVSPSIVGGPEPEARPARLHDFPHQHVERCLVHRGGGRPSPARLPAVVNAARARTSASCA